MSLPRPFDERITQLDALDFCWDVREANRKEFMEELSKFKAEHGHCHVPPNTPLGKRCSEVRDRYKRTDSRKLAEQWIIELNAMGFCWDSSEAYWNRFIAELTQFKAEHGHCNALHGTPLGNKCRHMRQGRKKGKLTKKQITELDAMGFCWDRRFDTPADPPDEQAAA